MFRSTHAGIRRPRRRFVIGGFAILGLIPAVLALVVATGVYPLLTLLVHCFLFGTMSLVYGYRSTKNAAYDTGTLAVTHRGLELDGRRIVEKNDLRQGFLVPTKDGVLVRIERKSFAPSIDVRVKDEAEGHELLHALGFDAEQTAAEMRVASGLLSMPMAKQMLVMLPPIFLVMLTSFLVALTMKHTGGPIVFGMVGLVIAYTFGIAFTPLKIRIGTDGIATRWLGMERFIPFDSITKIEKYDETIGTKRQLGVKVWTGNDFARLATGQTDIGETEAARLLERIEEARAAWKSGASATVKEYLARGERDAVEWIASLKKLGSGAHGLRTAAVPLDTLIRLVEDARAAPADRASAAVAVSSDPSARARIRVAAETTASPKLRVALERIADESATDADLASSLDQLR